jgi:hypothetical protein
LGENTPFLIVTVSRFGGFVPSGFVDEVVDVDEVGEVDALLELPHALATSAKPSTA